MLLLLIAVSSVVCASTYYVIKRRQLNKQVARLQKDLELEQQLSSLESQLGEVNTTQQKLENEVKQASEIDNPFVRAQKKRHKTFRASQTHRDSED